MPELPAMRVKIGLADFRRLCAGKPVRIISLAERPVELLLDDVGTVAMLRAVLDGALPEGFVERAEAHSDG